MPAYYNEIDPFAVQWLRNLVAAGHLPPGDVDDRSIVDVSPEDLIGYSQQHFFAGIGGWALAARLAGWPDDRPLCSGSPPCQPFSISGKGGGVDDPRHLWPHYFRLVRALRPPILVGEQVAGKAGYAWLDGVRSDLADEGYACRGVDIPACAVDAPHRRQRLYWIAVPVADADQPHRRPQKLGDEDRWTDAEGPSGRSGGRNCPSFWAGAEQFRGPDGKTRRAPPGLPLLDDGLPGRMAKWRAFGNAVVPQEAAEILASWLDVAP